MSLRTGEHPNFHEGVDSGSSRSQRVSGVGASAGGEGNPAPHLGTETLSRRQRRRRGAFFLLCASAGLLCTMIWSVGVGAVKISPSEVLDILVARAGFAENDSYTAQQDAVLWSIRLPRVLLGVFVGMGLAVSGASLQGIFRNPLADPALIGVSAGAAVGAVTAIVADMNFAGIHTVAILAFLGGTGATFLVYALSRQEGRTDVVIFVLTGVAVNAMLMGVVGFSTFIADDAELREITFWSLGSVGIATWESVRVVAPLVTLGVLALLRQSYALNVLSLGDEESRAVGVHTERTRMSVILCAALVTGATVSVAGIIGFIGLVVPHFVRLATGPDHRILLPASALLGAALVVLADLSARTVASPREIPLGVVTVFVGGPCFLWLLRRGNTGRRAWS